MAGESNVNNIGYRRLWREWLSQYSSLFIITIILMIIIALASAGYSKIIQMIIDAYEASDTSVIYWGPIGIILISTIKGLSTFLKTVSLSKALLRFEAKLQKAMYGELLSADLSRLQADTAAGLSVRFFSDVSLVRVSINHIFSALSSIFIIVATIGVMLSIDWQITLVMIVIFAIAVVPINSIGAKVRGIARKTQEELSLMNDDIVEGLSGIRMVRTYQLEDRLKTTSSSIFENLFSLRYKTEKWQARLSPIMEILSGLAVAVLLFIVSWRISRGSITVADFMGLLTAVGIIAQPARRLGSNFTSAMQGLVAIERIFAILDAKNTIVDHENAKSIEKLNGGIEFCDVSFSYPDGFKALDGVNISIPAGSKVALVGRSGAGKSTIFNLLPRLFDVTSGHIKIDGNKIEDISIACLRSNIAFVGQETVLLAGTVSENIGFGREGATKEQIVDAAKAAAADGFIKNTADGYDTVISSTGGNFSGGEKQRLSIARAILRDAPILMLDEPTSALDAESETAIRRALEDMSEGRTTLIIAHRLATILDADMIIVMDEGKVVQTGTHEELLGKGGLYSELYKMQFAGEA